MLVTFDKILIHQIIFNDFDIFRNLKKICLKLKAEKEDTTSILAKKEAFYQKFYSNFYDSYTITVNKKIMRKIA
jgi:hypothetical protein